MASIDDFAADVLFLLIGTNPLPNYVAAQLLAAPGATIYLLHTSEQHGPNTAKVAQRLETLLGGTERKWQIVLKEVADSDDVLITTEIQKICRAIQRNNPSARVGLNYTGGTKPMAVHAYRAVAECFPNASFSYLDPRRLALRVDSLGLAPERVYYLLKDEDLRRRVQMSLEQLAELHGYTLKGETPQKHDAGLLSALVQVHACKPAFDQWKRWLSSRPLQLPTPAAYDLLAPVIAVFDTLCAADSQSPGIVPEIVIAKHIQSSFSTLDSCHKWFKGEWLEEHVMHTLEDLEKENASIKPAVGQRKFLPSSTARTQKEFELDGAAMFGHQLYAVSSIASDKSDGETKKHLFEVYIRARQLGGDEARAGLVCCVDNPKSLLDEVEREWDAVGKLKVFGRKDLKNLRQELKSWIGHATA